MNWNIWICSNKVRPERLSSLVPTRSKGLRSWFERQLLDCVSMINWAVRIMQMTGNAIWPIFSWDMVKVIVLCGIIAMYFLL